METQTVLETPVTSEPRVAAATCLTLDSLPIGSHAVIVQVQSSNTLLRNKLLMMGLVRNTQVEVLNVAPLGDPMTIRVLGSKLSLRLSEAASIRVMLPA